MKEYIPNLYITALASIRLPQLVSLQGVLPATVSNPSVYAFLKNIVDLRRLERPTPCVSGRCSDQLSYRSINFIAVGETWTPTGFLPLASETNVAAITPQPHNEMFFLFSCSRVSKNEEEPYNCIAQTYRLSTNTGTWTQKASESYPSYTARLF